MSETIGEARARLRAELQAARYALIAGLMETRGGRVIARALIVKWLVTDWVGRRWAAVEWKRVTRRLQRDMRR